MSNSILQRLGNIKRKPKGGKNMSQNEKQRKASPFILKTVMFGQEEETIGEAIPENVFGDSGMNHIGT